MYCKNCGNEINENQKFCPKCGAKCDSALSKSSNASEFENTFSYTAKSKSMALPICMGIAVFLILFSVISLAVSNGKPEHKILGSWQISAASSETADFDNYPENEYLTFNSDGTGYLDGDMDSVFYYMINGDTITLDCDDWLFSYTYSFEIKSDELMLKYVSDMPIYYNKIDISEITTEQPVNRFGPMYPVEGEDRW